MASRPPIVIPSALAPLLERPRWVAWKWMTGKNGKPTKPPLQGRAPDKYASTTDAATWCDIDTAMRAYCDSKCDGIGFALNGSGFGAFDIDHCRDAKTGTIHPWAMELMRRCGSYAEITPSGTGVRIIGIASGPELHRKFSVPQADGMSVQIYRNAERYITVSGAQIGEEQQLANIDAETDAVASKLGNAKQTNSAGKNGSGSSKRRELDSLIRDGCGSDFGGDRSRALWYVIHQLLKRGDDAEEVIAIILNRGNRISDHVYDQPKPEAYARRQVERARSEAEANANKEKRPTKDVLIELAQEAELFHTPEGTPYADFTVHGHRETWPVRSKGFKRWLGRKYYGQTRSAPNSEAMQAALGVIEARAHYDAPEQLIATRVAGLADRIYIDLCNDAWQAIEVDEDGWRIVDEPPVRFRRANGMLPLPAPESGGNIEALRKYLNLTAADGVEAATADAKFVLTVSVLLAYMRARGPYPVLVLAGEHGACKSTFAAILRSLIDPNASALRALAREDRDLFIAATNGWVLAFDNVSRLPDWISDTLCRLATGGGFATRQLYTDDDEKLFAAMRPIVLNGIEDFIGRPDLADRSVFLTLAPITDEARQSELEFWTAFEKERPAILGAVLDMVSHGLRYLPLTKLERTPRMADFTRWAVACEGATFKAGTFLNAYNANRQGAVETVLEADIVATTLRAFLAGRESNEWTGPASKLLSELSDKAGETVTKSKEWPTTPNALSGRLRRASTFLRKVGINISFGRESGGRRRTVTITEAL
jgi:hypothetical protein